jgi:hypothetical protein
VLLEKGVARRVSGVYSEPKSPWVQAHAIWRFVALSVSRSSVWSTRSRCEPCRVSHLC